MLKFGPGTVNNYSNCSVEIQLACDLRATNTGK